MLAPPPSAYCSSCAQVVLYTVYHVSSTAAPVQSIMLLHSASHQAQKPLCCSRSAEPRVHQHSMAQPAQGGAGGLGITAYTQGQTLQPGVEAASVSAAAALIRLAGNFAQAADPPQPKQQRQVCTAHSCGESMFEGLLLPGRCGVRVPAPGQFQQTNRTRMLTSWLARHDLELRQYLRCHSVPVQLHIACKTSLIGWSHERPIVLCCCSRLDTELLAAVMCRLADAAPKPVGSHPLQASGAVALRACGCHVCPNILRNTVRRQQATCRGTGIHQPVGSVCRT